jgi:NAD(P)-dependent dehydrogenase (short-subunit alcohol dehydrogenase family)
MGLSKEPRAVVTGAGSGLGRAFCKDIVRRGGRVVASDVDEAAARETAAMLGEAAFATRCDVSKLKDVQALADFAESKLGAIDLVVDNAGAAVGGRIGDVPIEDWRWLIGVNLGEKSSTKVGVTVLCPTFFQTNIAKSSRGPDESMRQVAQKLMDAGKMSADEVARYALDTAAAGRLYAVPMADARWLWRLKRLMPERFLGMARRAAISQARKFGVKVEL